MSILPKASCSDASLLRRTAEGFRIAVRLQPGAGANRIEGIERAADGAARLKVRVTVAAEAGRANRALIKLLAKAWRLPARDIDVVVGAKSRNKIIMVHSDTANRAGKLENWFEAKLRESAG